MLPATRIRLANVLVPVAFVPLGATAYGMLQSPHPAWSRALAIPALVLAVAASGVRRRAGWAG